MQYGSTNGYTVNFFQRDKKIGEVRTLIMMTMNGTLKSVAELSFKADETSTEANKYEATEGYEFAGWSFKNGGTVSFADGASVKESDNRSK